MTTLKDLKMFDLFIFSDPRKDDYGLFEFLYEVSGNGGVWVYVQNVKSGEISIYHECMKVVRQCNLYEQNL